MKDRRRTLGLTAAILALVLALLGAVWYYAKVPCPGFIFSKEGLSNRETISQRDPSPYEPAGSGQELIKRLAPILNGVKGDYSLTYQSLTTADKAVINNHRMPSASCIKLFVMMTIYAEARDKHLELDDELVLRDSDKVGGTGVLQSRATDQPYSVRELVYYMITSSDNTATNMLIDRVGFKTINQHIRAIGCRDTVLQRKMMDFVSAKQGKENYTSVNDLATVLHRIYDGKCVSPACDREMIKVLKQQKQKDLIPAGLPSFCTVAHKPGNLPGITNDAAVVYTPKGDYIICFMSHNTDEAEMGFVIPRVSKMVYDYYLQTPEAAK